MPELHANVPSIRKLPPSGASALYPRLPCLLPLHAMAAGTVRARSLRGSKMFLICGLRRSVRVHAEVVQIVHELRPCRKIRLGAGAARGNNVRDRKQVAAVAGAARVGESRSRMAVSCLW